jgi:transposase
MEQIIRPDFTGQPFFIGIDTHKKSWKVSIFTEHLEHKTFTQPPDVDKLANYLRRNFPGGEYHVVYEAGFCGFWIHDSLNKEEGVDCIVVNPADVPTTDKEKKTKADPIDSRKLGRSLRNGELKGIYVPPRESVEDRNLVRMRQTMVKKQTRVKNQIKSLLYFYGIVLPEEYTQRRWSRKFIDWLYEIQMTRASGDMALKTLLDELTYLRQTISGLTKGIRGLALTEEYAENFRLLKTVIGISILADMILLTELVDINRFKNLDMLASYVGLIPDTESSGEKENDKGITKRRNPLLRHVLIEAAWTAVRKDPALMEAFNKMLGRGISRKVAIVKIARKLLNRIRYVLKNKKEYVPSVVQ